MMGTLFEHDFDWSKETIIEQFISEKKPFPQLIIITNGFYDSSFEKTIDNYQIICITGFSTQKRLNGYDSQKCELSLPMNCDTLKFARYPNSPWEQNFLFEIVRKQKLPCKVYLSEYSRDIFLKNHVERVEEKLSELTLTHESEAFFLYGFTLEEKKLHASDMITLPSYLCLTFKVAQRFKDERKSLENFLKQMDSKIKHIMPGYKFLKDIVFSSPHGVALQASTTPVIVSLSENIKKKKDVKTRRPLPPVPDEINSDVYEAIEPIDDNIHNSECLPSNATRYAQFPMINPPTENLKNSSETPSSKKTSDESRMIEIKSTLQKELASMFNNAVNLKPVPKKRLMSLPQVPPIPQRKEVVRRHSFVNDRQSYMELNNITEENKRKSECKWEVHHLSVKEVAKFLRLLGLEKFILAFQKEKVDGLILESLTEEILTNEFNMRRIESLRLLHFIKSGHIPK